MIEYLLGILFDLYTFLLHNFFPIIAIFVTLIIGILGLKRKGFSYYIESANSVVRVEEGISDKVEVLYEGNKVENVSLIVMTLRNSGNQTIEFDDFINDVTFNFGEKARFLSLSVVETEPSSLYPVFQHTQGMPFLVPLLLNRGDNFIVNFLVSGWDPDALKVRGRIKGVSDIKRESERSGLNQALFISTIISFVMCMSLVVFSSITGSQIITVAQSTYFLYFTFFLMMMVSITSREFRKSFRAFLKKKMYIGIG